MPQVRPGEDDSPGRTLSLIRRKVPMAHSLVTTDELLFSDEPPHVRVVAAATFGYPKRNPSLVELAKMTGLKPHTVKDAQNQLEAWSRAGTTVIAPLAQYDKPENWYERNPDNPRFQRSNELTRVFRPDYDPDRAKYRIELPASVLAKLPRGQKNSAILRLVACAYAREQLRRGAIQIDDATLAEQLQLRVQREGFGEETNVAQVTRARETLLRRGVLVVHDADADPPIYTMPGATPGKPENPDELAPEATKKLRQHPARSPEATGSTFRRPSRTGTRSRTSSGFSATRQRRRRFGTPGSTPSVTIHPRET